MRQLCFVLLAGLLASPPAFAADADWTVMVWLNGDNNLEEFIRDDWKELAVVGSTDRVNVVVQIDLSKTADTRRFRIPAKGGPNRLADMEAIGERNMVKGSELQEFVEWARKHHKAKRYALVISSHGDGWREFILGGQPAGPGLITASSRSATIGAADVKPQPEASRRALFLPPGVFGSPNRSINADDTDGIGDALYNREIADSLKAALKGDKLNLLVFDACLMGMIEVAYGMRDVAEYFVASEELVQNGGFNYTPILAELVARPSLQAEALAGFLVREYETLHGVAERDDPARTLAAFRLDQMGEVAKALSRLSVALIDEMADERETVARVRRRLPVYAEGPCGQVDDCLYHVDLKRFADLLARYATSPIVKEHAQEVSLLIADSRVARYAGAHRDCDYGSEGLAIYFPATANEFRFDPLQERAYRKANQDHPVEFVQNEQWSEFLHVYFFNAREAEVAP